MHACLSHDSTWHLVRKVKNGKWWALNLVFDVRRPDYEFRIIIGNDLSTSRRFFFRSSLPLLFLLHTHATLHCLLFSCRILTWRPMNAPHHFALIKLHFTPQLDDKFRIERDKKSSFSITFSLCQPKVSPISPINFFPVNCKGRKLKKEKWLREEETETIDRYLLFHPKNFLPRFLWAILIVLIDICPFTMAHVSPNYLFTVSYFRLCLNYSNTYKWTKLCTFFSFYRINKFSLLFKQRRQRQSIFVINWIKDDFDPKKKFDQTMRVVPASLSSIDVD